jgi:hypothetical protein
MKTVWFNPDIKKTKAEVIQIKDLIELSSILGI